MFQVLQIPLIIFQDMQLKRLNDYEDDYVNSIVDNNLSLDIRLESLI